jgi:hypothetical protein
MMLRRRTMATATILNPERALPRGWSGFRSWLKW